MNVLAKIKKKLIGHIVRLDVMRQLSITYCLENNLLPSIFVKTPSNRLRELLNLPASEFNTQLNQDIFALLMNQFCPGYFLEIGANDGFTLSNTVYLESNYDWNGVLVEANKKYLPSLLERKKSKVICSAVSHETGKAEFLDAGLYGGLKYCIDSRHVSIIENAPSITVDCMSLKEILDVAKSPQIIDFVSIDVEGGELPIVEQLVSLDRRFKCGCIEYNNRKEDYNHMVELLVEADYRVIWEGQTKQDLFFVDNARSDLQIM